MPLFINPSIHPKAQWPFITRNMSLQPPLGIGFLAGYLRKKMDVPIRVIDECIQTLDDATLTRELDSLDKPRIVCLSSMTLQIGRTMDLAKKIKGYAPDTTVIIGGVHPTVMPHEPFERGNVDIVVRREGEEVLAQLCERIYAGKDYRDVRGISYVGDNGTIIDNPDQPIVDLKTVPLFPFDLFEKNIAQYNAFGSLCTSRGCPYNCIFCSNRNVTGNLFRHFPIKWVEESLDILIHKYKQDYIMFVDDVMFVDKKHFFAVADMILRRGFHKKASFQGGARADTITPEIVAKSKEANFSFFGVGVETSSERLLKVLDKKETAVQIKKAIDLITEQGMMTSGAFIYGIPTETREERKQSLEYALALPIDNARFNNIVPYPGTALYEMAKRENKLVVKKDYYNFNVQYYLFGNDIPYVPEGSNRFEIIFDTMWANLRYYFRPRTFQRFKKYKTTGGGTIHIPANKRMSLYWDMARFGFLVFVRFIYVGSIVFGIRLRQALTNKTTPGATAGQ
ncbi:MAG: radical SAM protein [Candidatus Omnitrophota bacterium]